MSSRLLVVDFFLHDTILIDTKGREEIQGLLITRINAIKNQADNDLLPRGAAFIPKLGFLEIDDIAHVLHDAVQGAGSQHLILVVVRDGDEQLCVAVVHGGAQIIPVLQREVAGVARRGRVAHVRELLLVALLVIAVFRLDCVLHRARHGIVHAQYRALHQLDFTGLVPAHAKPAAAAAAAEIHGLPLPPAVRRARLAAWRARAFGRRSAEARRAG